MTDGMKNDNVIPLFSMALLACAIAYLWAISGQPRMADGGLSDDEMSLAEKVFVLVLPLSVFATMFIAIRRAYRNRSWFWSLACLCWPLAFVYTLLVKRSDTH